MVLLEKITPIGINTDVSPEALEHGNQGDRAIINPILDALNKHYYTSESGLGMKSENIKGNLVVLNFLLPAGTNICIGSYEDRLNNKLIYFNYNSNGNHGVYAYSPETNLITVLIQIPGLNFQNDRRYLITGVGSVGQLLYWSDGYNPQRVINMTRSYTYVGVSVADITLIKPAPIMRPAIGNHALNANQYNQHCGTVDRSDNGLAGNKITALNLQFSYRIKYLDNEYSVLAPYSEVSYADFDPDFFTKASSNPTELSGFSYFYNNQIYVSVPLTGINYNTAKQVELLFREGNTGTWKIWKTFQAPITTISAYFTYGDAVIDLDTITSSKLFEAVPNFSKALVVHKNRVILSADQENFDVNDNPTITITPHSPSPAASNTISQSITIAANQAIAITTTGFSVGDRIALVTNDGANSFSMFGTVTSAGNVYIDTASGTGAHPLNSSFGSWLMFPVISNPYKTYWKQNAVHIFAIAVFDSSGRCMGVVSKTQVNIKTQVTDGRALVAQLGNYASFGNPTLNVDIAGSFAASPKVAFMSLVATEDQFYQTYYQTNIRTYFYKYDVPSTGTYTPGSGEIVINGKVFLDHRPSSLSEFTQIYLQVPKDMAITLDTTFYVRPVGLTPIWTSTPKIEKVLSVIGDWVVVNNFGVNTWTAIQPNFTVEFFTPKTAPTSELFYELSDRIPVAANGTFTFPTIPDLHGPVYVICKGGNVAGGAGAAKNLLAMNTHFQFYDQQTYNLHNPEPPYITAIDGRFGVIGPSRFQKNADALLFAESPTPTTVRINTPQTSNVGSGFLGTVTLVVSSVRTLIMDYTKIAWNMGKAIADVLDKKLFSRTSVLRFSNSYAQGTNINGLSSFDSANQYTLALDRGDITKIVTIGNRLLVIHEFSATSVFTNENVITNADGSQNLIASAAVVSYDRALQDGGYGCYHPESIAQVDGMVFGFDVYAGVVWRYTEAGQFPISNYGRKEYFRTKSKTYLANKDSVKVLGGIDRFHKEYVITFNDGTGASETIAFNYEKEKWTTRYSFVPEYYGQINNKFISFQNGQVWVHNENSIYNNFYGVGYPSFIKWAINPHPSWLKDYMGLQLDIEALSSNIDFKQIELSTAQGQYSYLKPDEFEKFERVFYASILKDIFTNPALLTPNTNNSAPVLSGGANDANSGSSWTISSQPSVSMVNTDPFARTKGLTYSYAGVANIAYTVQITFNIVNAFSKQFDITLQSLLSGAAITNVINSIRATGSGNDTMTLTFLLTGTSNFDQLKIFIVNDDVTGSGSNTFTVQKWTIYSATPLREGDSLRAKYLTLQVNDDSTVRNSMQMLNLSYVRSEYSE